MRFLSGTWGISTYYRAPIAQLVVSRFEASLLLAGSALLVHGADGALFSACSPACARIAALDRGVSVFSILTTSIPDFASAVFLSAIFVFWLGWLPGASTMLLGFSLKS